MVRIFCISDIHTSFTQNLQEIENLPTYQTNDILIVAGDVAEKVDLILYTLSILKKKFNHVFYCPGNHDLWINTNDKFNSLEKFYNLLLECEKIGVKTKPDIIENIIIVPLFGWYQTQFDTEPTTDDELEKLKKKLE